MLGGFERFMNSRLLYNIVFSLSLLTAIAAAILFVVGGVHFYRDDWQTAFRLFGVASILFVLAVIMFALWDIGIRLIGVEEEQLRFIRDQK